MDTLTRRFVLAVAVLVPTMAPGRASANLIVNGSFETPDVGSTFALPTNGGVPGWTGVNNQMEIDFTPILSPGVGTPAFNGKQSTEIDDFVVQISQTITGLTLGGKYLLTWAYGLRPGAGFQSLNVTFGGALVTINSGTAGALGTPLIWIPNSFTVTATAATQILSFTEVATGLSTAGNEIDAVTLDAVPEPSSLVLACTGTTIGVGSWLRRRKRVAA